MEKLLAVWAWLHSDAGLALLAAIIAADTALGYIPAVKSNSVFQAISNGLAWVKQKLSPSA